MADFVAGELNNQVNQPEREMTLYEIGIIAWHYTTPLPFPQEDAPLYKPTIDGFVEAGLMTESKRITAYGPLAVVK